MFGVYWKPYILDYRAETRMKLRLSGTYVKNEETTV